MDNIKINLKVIVRVKMPFLKLKQKIHTHFLDVWCLFHRNLSKCPENVAVCLARDTVINR